MSFNLFFLLISISFVNCCSNEKTSYICKNFKTTSNSSWFINSHQRKARNDHLIKFTCNETSSAAIKFSHFSKYLKPDEKQLDIYFSEDGTQSQRNCYLHLSYNDSINSFTVTSSSSNLEIECDDDAFFVIILIAFSLLFLLILIWLCVCCNKHLCIHSAINTLKKYENMQNQQQQQQQQENLNETTMDTTIPVRLARTDAMNTTIKSDQDTSLTRNDANNVTIASNQDEEEDDRPIEG